MKAGSAAGRMKTQATLDVAVVDSSVIMSIFERRVSAEAFQHALKQCVSLCISAATVAELSILFRSRKGAEGPKILDSFLANRNISIMAFDKPDLEALREGCDLFGKGNHPANLNFGDLFAYSLAKKLGLPILYEGLDFSQTDLVDAMKELGYSFTKEHSPFIERGGSG